MVRRPHPSAGCDARFRLWPRRTLSGCHSASDRPPALLVAQLEHRAREAPTLARDPFFVAAIAAERSLPRDRFVPPAVRRLARLDVPLPIGWGQTISDPYIVAVMTASARVRRGSNVLEIGTGSGYQAAVLSRLGARVATIEIVPPLARRAAATLRRLGFGDVALRQSDGFVGWRGREPFNAIIVTAGITRAPPPLLAQLAVGGRLVIPVGPIMAQERLLVIRN